MIESQILKSCKQNLERQWLGPDARQGKNKRSKNHQRPF